MTGQDAAGRPLADLVDPATAERLRALAAQLDAQEDGPGPAGTTGDELARDMGLGPLNPPGDTPGPHPADG